MDDNSPLLTAAQQGDLESVESLLDAGTTPEICNSAGQTPLFLACWNGHFEVAQTLIGKGASVNASDQRGWTPLIISVFHNYFNVASLLLRSGANPQHKDMFGKRAIDRAKDSAMAGLLQDAARIAKSENNSKPRSKRPPLPAERRRKSDEVDSYIKEEAARLETQMRVEWTRNLQNTVQEEVSKSETRIQVSIEDLVRNMGKEIYQSLANYPDGFQQVYSQSLYDEINEFLRVELAKIGKLMSQAATEYLGDKISGECCVVHNLIQEEVERANSLVKKGAEEEALDKTEKRPNLSMNEFELAQNARHPRSRGSPSRSSYSPSERPASALHMNDRLKEMKKPKQKVGIPRTNVAATLQQFLKEFNK